MSGTIEGVLFVHTRYDATVTQSVRKGSIAEGRIVRAIRREGGREGEGRGREEERGGRGGGEGGEGEREGGGRGKER